MFLIRNIVLERLVTDGSRTPINFKTIEEARHWIYKNGNHDWFRAIHHEAHMNEDEKKQFLKVNFQEA